MTSTHVRVSLGPVPAVTDALDDAVVSPDGRHIVYQITREQQVFLVSDGSSIGPFVRIMGIAFSPDSKRLAYVADKGSSHAVVVDGRTGPDFDEVMGGWITFTADSRSVGYIARTGRHWHAVCDHVAGPSFDGIRHQSLSFGVDPVTPVYCARRNPNWHIVHGDAIGPPFDEVGGLSPVISRDGKRTAYCARRGASWYLVADKVIGSPFEDFDDPIFSPDSRRLAYVATIGGTQILFVDGHRGPEGTGFGKPVFSPDSKRIACGLGDSEGSFMYSDGRLAGPFEDVDVPVFSPDSTTLVFAFRRRFDYFISLNGRSIRAPFDDLNIGEIVFRADSQRIAFSAATSGSRRMIDMSIDGSATLGPLCEVILHPALGPGATSAVYLARHEGKSAVMHAGKPLLHLDGVVRGAKIVVDESGLFHVIAIHKQEIVRIEGVLPLEDLRSR